MQAWQRFPCLHCFWVSRVLGLQSSLAEISVPSLLLSFTSCWGSTWAWQRFPYLHCTWAWSTAAEFRTTESKSTLGLHSWGPTWVGVSVPSLNMQDSEVQQRLWLLSLAFYPLLRIHSIKKSPLYRRFQYLLTAEQARWLACFHPKTKVCTLTE